MSQISTSMTSRLARLGASFLFMGSMAAASFAQIILSPPTDLTAAGTNWYTIGLRWNDTASNELGFEVERSTDGTTFERIAVVGYNAEAYTDTGWAVAGSMPLQYRIRAMAAGGYSAYSNIATGATTPQPPDAPASFAATAVSSSAISLTWTDTSSNEDGFELHGAASGKSWSLIATIPANGTQFSHTGLAASTTYTYRLKAFNAGGWKWSETVGATTPTTGTVPPPPTETVPDAPTSLAATVDSNTRINLTWSDNASNEAGYVVERSNGGAFTRETTLNANTTSYVSSGLTAGTAYQYRVYAYNSIGNSVYSNTVSATTTSTTTSTTVPAMPGDFKATPVSATEIAVTWTDTSTNEDGFELHRAGGGASWAILAKLPANTTRYDDTNLKAETAYRYRLKAFNSRGWTWTDIVTATTPAGDAVTPPPTVTPPAVPTALAATAASESRIDLAWTDNASNETGYVVERANGGAFSRVTTLAANATSYANTGLASATEYQYRVYAYNGGGNSSYSNIAIATTKSIVTPPPTTITLNSVSVSPSTVIGGTGTNGQVTLSGAAPSGGTTVTLADNSAASAVPQSVVVPAGATSATFTVTTQTVSATTTVSVQATLSGTSKSATLTVTPQTTTPPPIGTGRVFYVSPSGSDSAAGTISAPWKTLSKSIATLAAGDTLYVRGGTYVEKVTPSYRKGTAASPITVMAYPGERPVLSGIIRITGADYWTFDGLNVTWNSAIGTNTDHMVKLTNGIGWTYKNAEIWGAHSFAGMLVAGTTAGQPDKWTVSHNVIHDIYPTNMANQDHCIYTNTGLNPGHGVIERNVLYNATNGEAVKLAGTDENGACSNIIVRYNTMYNTAQSVLVGGYSHDIQLYGNLMSLTQSKYGHLRGYMLKGAGNVAHNNAGNLSKSMILNDAGYLGIKDLGGNVFPVDPMWDRIAPDGFNPTNPLAKAYGHTAP